MDPLQAITLAGAGGVALWVLKQLVDGKLHTHSEVEGLKADKAELWKANAVLQSAVDVGNKTLLEILSLVRDDAAPPGVPPEDR